MKKLGKLTINPEKVIKNDELVNLRGGSYSGDNRLACWDWNNVLVGPVIIDAGCNGETDHDLGICKDVYRTKRTHSAVCVRY